jgi:hypothetical protein
LLFRSAAFGLFLFSGLFVSLVYYAESTVRWFVVREKHCWMAADSADKFKRTGRSSLVLSVIPARMISHGLASKASEDHTLTLCCICNCSSPCCS